MRRKMGDAREVLRHYPPLVSHILSVPPQNQQQRTAARLGSPCPYRRKSSDGLLVGGTIGNLLACLLVWVHNSTHDSC
ncbi:unnamed protein product [Vitrella brassicaformis CCMP3155]|uniref:Uncharacterized protein n=1 Tax=Vitrella brassicaformis (strain CCMP3155) TaxID=1169540 RepID=A0A0G4EDH2_VITBC|nr:unnamed protein product [Vitrella brassicaformis CCMP3155]|eukprot:CEL93406.1 unnamed protein product [Vitrella brassicaformis CCMP3155]